MIDSVHFISLGFRHEASSDPAKLETSTYINFDLLYRNGTNRTPNFPRSVSHVRFTQGTTTEPDKVYSQWPVSFLTAYGTVPCNDRRLLVAPEVGPFVITAT